MIKKTEKTLILLFLFLIFLKLYVNAKKEIYFTPAGKKVEIVSNYVLVRFNNNISSIQKKSILNETNTKTIHGIERLNIEMLEISREKTISSTINDLILRDDVLHAEPVYIRRAMKLPTEYSDKKELSRQWGLNRIGAPEGWDIETGDGVVIAVLDSGIEVNHSDLNSNVWINPNASTKLWSYTASDNNNYDVIYDTHGWDFINNDNDPADDMENSHGTHIAGIIGAVPNNAENSGTVGVAWNNKIMALKVLDSEGEGNSVSFINAVIYAADRGANVINMSLGGDPESQFERDAVNYAYNKGVVMFASAGNESGEIISYPAGYENVICVGATNFDDEWSEFSNYSEIIDIAAPGEYSYSTIKNNKYGQLNGTSVSSPYAAGLASLVISYWNRGANTNWTPQQVKNAITSNCDDINSAEHPGWDKFTGYGRINVRNTLEFISKDFNTSDKDVLVYPNPFNPDFQRAKIVIPESNEGIIEEVSIYTLSGKKVRDIFGSGSVAYWDGRNDEEEKCATGLYLFYLNSTSGSEKGKITLIR